MVGYSTEIKKNIKENQNSVLKKIKNRKKKQIELFQKQFIEIDQNSLHFFGLSVKFPSFSPVFYN